jgi:hypothetical protein
MSLIKRLSKSETKTIEVAIERLVYSNEKFFVAV